MGLGLGLLLAPGCLRVGALARLVFAVCIWLILAHGVHIVWGDRAAGAFARPWACSVNWHSVCAILEQSARPWGWGFCSPRIAWAGACARSSVGLSWAWGWGFCSPQAACELGPWLASCVWICIWLIPAHGIHMMVWGYRVAGAFARPWACSVN